MMNKRNIRALEDEIIILREQLKDAMGDLGVPQQADDSLFKGIVGRKVAAFVNQLRAMLFWFRLHARMGVLDAVIKMIKSGEQYTEPSLLNGELETLDINAMKLQLDRMRDFIRDTSVRDTSVNKNTLEAIVRKEMETMKTIFAQHRRISHEQSSSSDPKECFKYQEVLCGSKRREPEGASDEPPEGLKKLVSSLIQVECIFFSTSQSNQNNIKNQVIIRSRLNEKPDWQRKFITDFMENYQRLGQPGFECTWPSLNDKPGFNDSSDNDVFLRLDSIVIDWKSKNYDVRTVMEAVDTTTLFRRELMDLFRNQDEAKRQRPGLD